ncbi:13584_t:CDS:2 [Dentiscutata erythropus]|uniref:13584_t:CDS:1 n=1 Tax=Dentiscutata erythropus TaxID=1348616 RepID=A0A9N9NBI9_9GLOM|nr:13584_t:CDS:2 [Dentiscutata erythropus]
MHFIRVVWNYFKFSGERDVDEDDMSRALILYTEELEKKLGDIKKFNYSKFKDRKFIGRGGSAVVYSAVFHGKKYALKSLNNNLSIDKKIFKETKRELGILYQLDHPNIVKFHGVSIGM